MIYRPFPKAGKDRAPRQNPTLSCLPPLNPVLKESCDYVNNPNQCAERGDHHRHSGQNAHSKILFAHGIRGFNIWQNPYERCKREEYGCVN